MLLPSSPATCRWFRLVISGTQVFGEVLLPVTLLVFLTLTLPSPERSRNPIDLLLVLKGFASDFGRNGVVRKEEGRKEETKIGGLKRRKINERRGGGMISVLPFTRLKPSTELNRMFLVSLNNKACVVRGV